MKCGAKLPDDASFCMKCGAPVSGGLSGSGQVGTAGFAGPTASSASSSEKVFAPSGVTQLKCPSCGAPIVPKFGEMVITCEYCGSSITLANEGWKNIEKHTMLPLKLADKDQAVARIRSLMDRGFLKRHLEETSTQEELTLSYVPYWIIPVSARTNMVATDVAVEAGTIATTAALLGVMGGMGGGRRGGMGFGTGVLEGTLIGGMVGGGGGGAKRSYTLDCNYNFPVVALKALTQYQPKEYEFKLDERVLFDVSKIPKGVKVLNGDVSEDAAKYQAKTYVDQLQSQKAHEQHHMIQQINTEEDIADGELLHAPVWFARYDHKGKKIVLVIDANSGDAINSIGL